MGVMRRTIDSIQWRIDRPSGGYFHQDWALDYATADEAVDAFAAAATPDVRLNLLHELRDLLHLSDQELAAAIVDLGAYYDPGAVPGHGRSRPRLHPLAATISGT